MYEKEKARSILNLLPKPRPQLNQRREASTIKRKLINLSRNQLHILVCSTTYKQFTLASTARRKTKKRNHQNAFKFKPYCTRSLFNKQENKNEIRELA